MANDLSGEKAVSISHIFYEEFVQSCELLFSDMRTDTIYARLLDGCFRILENVEIALLFTMESKGDELELKKIKGVELHQLKNIRVGAHNGIKGEAVKTGNRQISDLGADLNEHISSETLSHRRITSMLAIPFEFSDETGRAVLCLYFSKLTCSEFQLEFLKLFANHAARAIKSSEMRTNLSNVVKIAENRTRRFNTLREISEALVHRQSLKDVLNIITRECLSIVGHENNIAYVLLIDSAKKVLTFRAIYGANVDIEQIKLEIPLSQNSIASWVIQNKQSKIANDVRQDKYYLKVFPATKSEICIPLFFREDVIGVINVESSSLNAFNNEHLELLQVLAENASIATKIAELYNVHLKQLQALYKIGTKINSSLNLVDVLNSIARETLSALGPDKRIVYIQLISNDGQRLEIKAVAGDIQGVEYMGDEVSINEGVSGWVVRHQKPYICSDVSTDEFYIRLNPQVRSELCVPIKFMSDTIGLINVESMNESDFGEYELRLIEGVANQAGTAIENAILSENLVNTQYDLARAMEIAIIGETVGGLTHDIGSIASLISGEVAWIERLQDQGRLSLEDISDAVGKIRKQTERLTRLTDDLGYRSSQHPAHFEQTNIIDILRECVYLMKRFAQVKNVAIKVACTRKKFLAPVDKPRLRRVFINIVKNAIEAMPDGGELSIDSEKENGFITIKFKDNGVGISSENLSRIWDSLFTTKKWGTGFGLSICKRFIEKDHNGLLECESTVNVGTIFTIKLPIQRTM